MIEMFPKQELDEFDGRALKEALQPFQFTKEGLLWVPAKNLLRAKKLLELKDLIEYRWCLPIIIKDGGLLFNAYSTHKFLTLTEQFIKCSKQKRNYIDSLLREHRRAKLVMYGAGGIEKAPDHGIGYRRDLKKCMKMTKVKIIDPCDFKYNKDNISLTEYGKHHTLDEYVRQCRRTVSGDLQAVLDADIIALNIDEYMGSGSTSEITVATAVQKPVYGIIAEGYDLKNMNPWALGNVTRFFKDMNALREFIIEGEK